MLFVMVLMLVRMMMFVPVMMCVRLVLMGATVAM